MSASSSDEEGAPLVARRQAAGPPLRTVQTPSSSMPWPRFLAALPHAGLACAATLGFGVSFFGNSAAGHWLGPGLPERWVALFLRCVGNALGTALVLAVLAAQKARSVGTAHADASRRGGARGISPKTPLPPVALSIDGAFGLTLLASALSTSAYVPFGALTDASGEVSVLTGMAGLHGIVPAVWALVFWGEPRTPAKLAGVALSAAAVLALGVGDARSFLGPAPLSPGAAAFKGACFVAAVGLWGASDLINTATAIGPAPASAALLLGNLIAGMVFACLHLASPPPPPPAAPAREVAWGWGHAAILGANVCGILGRLAFIRLGQLGQASSFAPVVAL